MSLIFELKQCVGGFYDGTILACVIWPNVEVILQYHLFAVYGYKRAIMVPVMGTFVLCSGLAWGLALGNIIIAAQLSSPPELGICTSPKTPLLTASWIPLMVMDALLMVLIGFKTVKYHLQVVDRSWTGASLMKTFGQGAFLCYCCVFFSGVLLVLLSLLTKAPFTSLGGPVLVSLSTMSINRLVFDMNKVSKAQENAGAGTSIFTVRSAIAFAVGPQGQINLSNSDDITELTRPTSRTSPMHMRTDLAL